MANERSDEKRVRICFVICPIGAAGSDDRKRSDKLLKHIIAPVCKATGYKVERADKMPNPGIITNQIVEHLLDADLVVADLTGKNPNVFYELGVRHVTGKPFVQLIHEKADVPFDIANVRTITYSLDVDGIKPTAEELRSAIDWINENPSKIVNPVLLARNTGVLLSRENTTEQSIGQMMTLLSSMSKLIEDIKSDTRQVGKCVWTIDDLKSALNNIESLVRRIDVPDLDTSSIESDISSIERDISSIEADIRDIKKSVQ